MSALDLIQNAAPSALRAPWCVKMHDLCLSALIEDGDTAKAAGRLSEVAQSRNMDIVEVCRVKKGAHEAAYARLEPKANPT